MKNALYTIVTLGVTYFQPISTMIYVILLFILIDFLTGMYAAHKTHKPIISSKLKKTLEKFVFYSLAVIVGYIFQKEILSGINLVQLVGGFIASIELLSIYENIKKITGLDIINQVKAYLQEQLKKIKK